MGKMKVVFIASLYEKEAHQFHYLAIIDLLESQGHTVLHTHVTEFDIDTVTHSYTENLKFHNTVLAALKQADCVVAEVTRHSMGVGFLFAEALKAHKPILALASSPQIHPLTVFLEQHENFLFHHYSYITQLEKDLPGLFNQFEPRKQKKFNVFLPLELDEYLLHTAGRHNISKSAYVRKLLEEDRLQPL